MFKLLKKSDFKYSLPLAICGALAISVWQYTEWRIENILSGMNRGLEKMAQVQKKNNSVKRNNQGQLLWQNLEAGEFIYVGNSVQTDADSSSLVFLNSGEKVLIGPQSLVRFIKSDNQLTLQLIDGQLEVKTAEPAELAAVTASAANKASVGRTVIETPKGKIKVKKSSLRLQVDENKPAETKIQVLSGTAEVTDATGVRELNINENSEAVVIPDIKAIEADSTLPLQSHLAQEDVSAVRNPAEASSKMIEPPTSVSPPPSELATPKVKRIKVEVVE